MSSILRVFQESYRRFQGNFMNVSRKIYGCVESVLRVFQVKCISLNLEGVLRELQRSFDNVHCIDLADTDKYTFTSKYILSWDNQHHFVLI